ncbi:MAG: hypothetical protein ACC652_13415, partial [Acidimicrobiales bacterium]
METEEVLGHTEPRLHTVRVEGSRSLVGSMPAVAELVGRSMHPWQDYAADLAMQVDDDDKWRSSIVTIVVARQQGKTWLAALRIVTGLVALGERVLLHSAQNLALAKETFDSVVEMLMTTPELAERVDRVVQRSGYEAVYMKDGAVYKILAGRPRSWIGKAMVDFQLFDEAREQKSMDL